MDHLAAAAVLTDEEITRRLSRIEQDIDDTHKGKPISIGSLLLHMFVFPSSKLQPIKPFV